MRRRNFLRTALAGGGGGLVGWQVLNDGPIGTSAGAAAGTSMAMAGQAARREPIIDIHLHAYPADAPIPASPHPVTGKPPGLTDGRAHLQACLAEMARLNIVTGVVSGGDGDRLAAAAYWRDAAPDRIIAAAGIRGSADIPLPEIGVLRAAFAEGRLRVLGEITAQYAGLSLSDPTYTPYLALAEELDVPVSVHMGLGPPGISFDPCCRGFRASLGNPAVLEEALNRHPRLRLNVMHGGWPYLQETIALLHAYLGALMRAGLGTRLLFGSDQMYWPDAIGMAVEGVESATFLTPADKRNIFYGNAVRFLRLGPSR